MGRTLSASGGLLLAEAVSFALSRHMARAEAQALVEQACPAAIASGRDLLEVVAELTEAPVDWTRLRAEAERPACAEHLVRRVLRQADDPGEET